MKKVIRLLTATTSASAALLLMTSCDSANKTDSAPPAAPKSTNAAVQPGGADAVVTARESLTESKQQFVTAAEAKLAQLDANLTVLRTKVSALAADARTESDKALEGLKEQRAKLGGKLDEAKQAGQDTWREVKAGFDAAWKEIEKGYADLKSKVNG